MLRAVWNEFDATVASAALRIAEDCIAHRFNKL